jgi:hypothetical protein
MVEYELKGLEPFKNTHFPFLYITEDKTIISSVISSFLKDPYGLEVGMGEEPTRVFNIDKSLPWMVTEPDERSFSFFKKHIQSFWMDIDIRSFDGIHPIVALEEYSSMGMQSKAQVIVYRNIDYRNMFMVPFQELQPKQRAVFIVDMLHVNEMDRYHDFLKEYGYDPRQLKVRSNDLPLLTTALPFASDDYVLDITK